MFFFFVLVIVLQVLLLGVFVVVVVVYRGLQQVISFFNFRYRPRRGHTTYRLDWYCLCVVGGLGV